MIEKIKYAKMVGVPGSRLKQIQKKTFNTIWL